MKRFILLLISLVLIVGCSAKPTENNEIVEEVKEEVIEETAEEVIEDTADYSFKVLSPKGAPALAILPLLEKNADNVTTVDGGELLQAALVNPSPEYDVIIAPSNLGAMLASNDKTTYKMLAIVTWGNLYIVAENEDSLNGGSIALFGEGTVPGLVFEETMKNISLEKTYFNSVADAQAALLSGKVDSAMLAEPLATATINKAKENGTELKIIADLQENWEDLYDNDGYPQAALFVIQEKYDENPKLYNKLIEDLDDFIDKIDDNEDELITLVDKYGVDILGIPNGNIAKITFDRMNVDIEYADENKEELITFLKLFNIEDLNNILIFK